MTVIDRHNYNTFQPLLYQVATAGLDEGGVAHTIRAIFADNANVEVQIGTVVGVDFTERVIELRDGAPVGYDALILAAGATTNDFGIPGVADHAFPLYTLSQAIQLRQHILSCFEATKRAPALVDEGALTCVIVGGGPTGVETAGTMAELFTRCSREGLPPSGCRTERAWIVIEMGQEPIELSSRVPAECPGVPSADRGVDVRFGESVSEVSARGCGSPPVRNYSTRTVVWTAGVRANALADRLGLTQSAGGRILVGPDLSLPDRPEVFVVGDVAASRNGTEQLLPQLRPAGRDAGGSTRWRTGHAPLARPADSTFPVPRQGTMATIGRHAAVAGRPADRHHATRTIAWLAWLLLHLVYLMGFRSTPPKF